MGITHVRSLFTLAAGVVIASCVRHHIPLSEQFSSAGTITFHNHTGDRIQVYLIGEKANWLLGRLEPYQTARLQLPGSSAAAPREPVSLAVIPGWSRTLQPGRDGRAALSIKDFSDNLPGEEWFFTAGQVHGPYRGPPL